MSKDNFKFKHTLRVRWKECDVQGIAYYGSYLDFIDVAQAEYFRNLGILTHNPDKREIFDLAAVKVTLEYKSPAKIDDLIDVFLRVEKIGNSSLDKRSEIYRNGTNDLLCSGQSISVNFDSDSGKSRNVPSEIKDIIEKFELTGQVNK
ncbi:acyl-CoA thioesterase [Chloroflexi bacterium]|nr:acyl-CoA thioesterase [Chloroflexota bacterium]